MLLSPQVLIYVVNPESMNCSEPPHNAAATTTTTVTTNFDNSKPPTPKPRPRPHFPLILTLTFNVKTLRLDGLGCLDAGDAWLEFGC
jgi:hypothetical protein